MSRHDDKPARGHGAWRGWWDALATRLGAVPRHPVSPTTTHGARLSYLPGLDGLRAIAVTAVLLYHAGQSWIPGGFLGVESFFVISGYLITALLLAEWQRAGRLDLKAFWLRRARRLLPALYLVLVVTLAVFVAALPDEVAKVRGDALAALAYVTNWYYILGQQSYFEAVGRPSPLLHLWSLAIEEQFYLLWPPLLWLLLRRLGARGAGWLALAGAAASAALLAALYRPGADPSRVYYGADTRAAGLLLGAALPLFRAPSRERGPSTRRRTALRDGAGLFALAVLLALFVVLDEFQPALYRGGFALVALATATAIGAAVSPHARLLPALLEWAPLRWIGVRSYSLYLWHWPVFVLTRPQLDLALDGVPLLALRLAATVALAEVSFRWVETPIRAGALGRAWRALRAPRDARAQRRVAFGSGIAGAGAGLLLTLTLATASAQPPPPPADLAAGSVVLTVPTPEPTPSPAASAEPELAPTPTPACAPILLTRLTAIGDSVMVGASGPLTARLGEGLYINAAVGRQPWDMPAFVKEQREAGQIGDIVIFHVGNNGYLTDDNFDAIMAELPGVRAVIFVNVRVPRNWERGTNSALAEGIGRHKNALLVDWYDASAGHPEYFREDGVHLTGAGQEVYAGLIAGEVEAARARWAARTTCGADGEPSPPTPAPAVPTAEPTPPAAPAADPPASD